jgi:hypothetical protein
MRENPKNTDSCMFVVVVVVVVLWEKPAKTVCLTSLVQALTTNNRDKTVCWESPNQTGQT